jgi:hypothetical protein
VFKVAGRVLSLVALAALATSVHGEDDFPPKISCLSTKACGGPRSAKGPYITEIYQAAAHGEVAARVDRWHAKARIGYAFPRPQGKSDLATASVTCAGSPCRI